MNIDQSCVDVHLCTSVVTFALQQRKERYTIRGNPYHSPLILSHMDPTRIRFIIEAMVRVMIRDSDCSVVMFGRRRVGCVVRCRRGVQSPT